MGFVIQPWCVYVALGYSKHIISLKQKRQSLRHGRKTHHSHSVWKVIGKIADHKATSMVAVVREQGLEY